MDSVLATLTIAGGVTGLLATLVTVPFTPARYWSWRLRRHAETVKAVAQERQPNQYEILMRRSDYLASRAAAAHHFPTDWGRFRFVIFELGFVVGVIASAIYMLAIGRKPWDNLGLVDIVGFVVATTICGLQALTLRNSYQHTRWHRARFINRGCPPDYKVPHTYMDALREAQRAEFDPNHLIRRRDARAATLRRTGTLPTHWKPVSWTATRRRRLSALVRGKAWYRGGFLG